ncbi:hypothetical protein CLNEO_27110 [Anaerotignum neopropionicum]|uniref:Uncharacterized protein n=1 Tax=Anaerotignum neopropionicum TaxID=36847 RepID=A0A136WBI2_9FIRM|nr:DUF134 domain-containing protein [Anaerotignum neopropionicum]KXL51855.1 hypothetical protein CLNEO_27110 [Anaerotignum neopropionicum]
MARPRKCRKVCALPENYGFVPMKGYNPNNPVIMAVDEYETIRLIDLVGYTQEECAGQMHIARTTVQGIYNEARKKMADALVNGKVLYIEGGDFALCDGEKLPCGKKCEKFCCKKIKEMNTEEM